MAPGANGAPGAERVYAALDAAARAEGLLGDALRGFIARELERALGADMAPAFAPPADARAPVLLRFMLDKWIGVFSDSPAARARPLVEAARDALRAHARPAAPAAELETARAVAAAAEALLLAVGARGPAAQVAEAWAAASGAPPPAPSPQPPQPPLPRKDAPAPGDAAMMEVEPAAEPAAGAANGPVLPPPRADRVPVVLDGSNLAWAHGRSARFSMYGAAEAAVHFRARGHAVALVLPDARVRVGAPAGAGDGERRAVAWVQGLRGSDMLVATPDEDYDDAYITHLARRAAAVVVSNDRFDDQVYQAQAAGKAAADGWRAWLRACRVSFAFHGDRFVPNPAFDFDRAARAARALALPPD